MKYYQYFFVILRSLVILQTVLVLSGKFSTEPHTKLVIDSLVKLGIGGFLFLFFLLNEIPGIDPWDAFIIRFAGVVLMLNIDFGGLLDILSIYSPSLAQHLSFLKTIQGA
uniref:Uncharacterized protein n=1 Tax=viral metagenome TaxID=1070528 RepID=A0A6C0DI78_9ZZZZ